MTAVLEAKTAMRRLANEAKSVVADETITVAERKEKLVKMSTDLKGFEEIIAMHGEAEKLMSGGEAPIEKAAGSPDLKTIGRRIVESDAFKSVAGAKGSKYSHTVEFKTAATVDEGVALSNGQLDGAAGVLALPDYQPGIVGIRYAPLSVAQLFAQGSTTSPIVSYVKQATETVGAVATAEKVRKGQSDATFARVNEQVGKITAFMKMTDEMIEDAEQAESFLTNLLIAEAQREEENEVLNGTGYPALAGILGRSGLQTAIAANGATDPTVVIEAVYEQVTAIRTTAFVEPDAVVMNPLDWQHIRLAKDKNGQYYAGGPFTGAYGNGGYSNVDALWGLRVVQSPRIASGTALVGGYAECGQLFRRQGITVEMTNSNEDDFVNNLITVRAESRSALAVYRPGGFGKVTIAWV